MSMLCTPISNQNPSSTRSLIWVVISKLIFPYLPSPAYRIRRIILRAFGASMDPHARVRGGVRISHPWNLTIGRKSSIGEGTAVFNPAPLTIGDRTVISQYCLVNCVAHADNNPAKPQQPAPLNIGNDVWIATECVVEGNQSIPNGILVGARSVITQTSPIDELLKPWTIATGHPAVSRRERPYQGPKA